MCQHLSFILYGKTTEGKSRSKPDPGNLAVRDCRGACGNMLHGLITICHEVGNDGYLGSYRPKTGVRHISISTVFTERFLRSENTGFPKSRRVIAITMLHTPCWVCNEWCDWHGCQLAGGSPAIAL